MLIFQANSSLVFPYGLFLRLQRSYAQGYPQKLGTAYDGINEQDAPQSQILDKRPDG